MTHGQLLAQALKGATAGRCCWIASQTRARRRMSGRQSLLVCSGKRQMVRRRLSGRSFLRMDWACSDALWAQVRGAALEKLRSAPVPGAVGRAPTVRTDETEGRREVAPANGRAARAPSIKDFAGSVSFLPAHPMDLPASTTINGVAAPSLGKLELDVLTCHHREY